MIVIGLLGYGMNRAMVLIQRRVVRWQVKSIEA
jgi:ABC-type nitrate/sulfonate/bicarbonate transport system permease component